MTLAPSFEEVDHDQQAEQGVAIRTTAMAVASAYSNASRRPTMRTGAISVLDGLLAEMNTTEPYSPIARASVRGEAGPTARKQGWQQNARECRPAGSPEQAAASSTSASRFQHRLDRPHDERQPMKVRTSTIPVFE